MRERKRERERERERLRISPTAVSIGFLVSGKEAKKILSLSLYTLLHTGWIQAPGGSPGAALEIRLIVPLSSSR